MTGSALVVPAVVAPTRTTAAAEATVYTGGTFQNREGQLPANANYTEYDVYPRANGAARDAYRIVVNRSTKETWFTPDHYVNFYKL